MSETRRKSTREFKVAAVKRMQAAGSVARHTRELEVNANQLHLRSGNLKNGRRGRPPEIDF
jgi:transposase-like protein